MVENGTAYLVVGESRYPLQDVVSGAIEAHISETESMQSADMAERLALLIEPVKIAIEKPVFRYMVASQVSEELALDLSQFLFRDE